MAALAEQAAHSHNVAQANAQVVAHHCRKHTRADTAEARSGRGQPQQGEGGSWGRLGRLRPNERWGWLRALTAVEANLRRFAGVVGEDDADGLLAALALQRARSRR